MNYLDSMRMQAEIDEVLKRLVTIKDTQVVYRGDEVEVTLHESVDAHIAELVKKALDEAFQKSGAGLKLRVGRFPATMPADMADSERVVMLEKALQDLGLRYEMLSKNYEATKIVLRAAIASDASAREALDRVQARCNELFAENRRLRGIADEIKCCVCKRVESLPPKGPEFNEQLAIYRGWRKADDGWICSAEH